MWRFFSTLSAGVVLLPVSAAWAADELKFGPAPAWVIPSPIPSTSAAPDAPIAILLNDQQLSLERGRITTHSEGAMRIQNSQGLAAGNIALAWNPATETVTVNKLEIHRGDKVINVLAGQSFTTLRREANLEAAMLDGTLTANIQPEGLQVGDMILLETTTVQSDPVLKGHVESVYGAWNGVPFASARARLSWPSSTQIATRQSADLPTARTSKSAGTTVFEVVAKNLQPLIAPKGAPPRFGVGRFGEVTDFHAWSQVADLFAPLYRESSVIAPTGSLRDELNRIKGAAADPKTRTEQALRLVQDRTRYVALLMGQGSYVPALAEETWKRRFGDCKAKTALLLALLHELGIEAEPVLVNSIAGDVIGDRLPMVEYFNHVLVRAHIDGKAYWLDGTRTGDRSLDQIAIPDFAWGLPLVPNAQLISILPPPLEVPNRERMVEVDASGGIFARAKATLHELYRDDAAVALNAVYSQLSPAQRDELLTRTAKSYFDDFEIATSSTQFDDTKRQFDITISGAVKLDWQNDWFLVPTSSISFDPDFDRPAGPFHDAPIQIGYPRFVKDVAILNLPPGVAAKQKLDAPIKESLAGVEYRRTETVTGDTITVLSSERALVPEIAYKEALAAKSRLKRINDDDVYLRAPDAYQLTPEDVKARLAESPSTSDEYFERGLRLLNSSNFDAAIADFTESLKLKPANEWPLANRALAYVYKEDAAKAAKDMAAADALNPKNPVTARARALLAERSGDFKAAIDAYSRSLEADPDNTWALAHRAMARRTANDDEGALTDSAAVLAQEPSWMELRVLRANIFWLRGDKTAVAHEAELVTKENPKSQYAWVAAGRIYSLLGRREDAVRAFDAALGIKPEPYVYLNRAHSRPKSDHSGRMNDLQAAMKLKPDDVDTMAAVANEYSNMGDFKHSLEIYDQLVVPSPGFSQYVVARAAVLQKAGRHAEAERILMREGQKAKTASDLNTLCWTKATTGIILESALLDCRRALKLKPDNGPYLDSLGLTLLKLGRLDEALEVYNQAIAKRAGAASLMGRAMVYYRKGERTHADADAAATRNLNPEVDQDFAEYGLKR